MDMLSEKSNYREMMWLEIFTETTTTFCKRMRKTWKETLVTWREEGR